LGFSVDKELGNVIYTDLITICCNIILTICNQLSFLFAVDYMYLLIELGANVNVEEPQFLESCTSALCCSIRQGAREENTNDSTPAGEGKADVSLGGSHGGSYLGLLS
jgi:hypothetical protein